MYLMVYDSKESFLMICSNIHYIMYNNLTVYDCIDLEREMIMRTLPDYYEEFIAEIEKECVVSCEKYKRRDGVVSSSLGVLFNRLYNEQEIILKLTGKRMLLREVE